MNKLYAKIAATAASVVLLGGLFATSVMADPVIDPSLLGPGLVIAGNGAHSENEISITNTSNCNVVQTNTTSVGLNVNLSASTGGNTASGNTGGSTSITTGAANATSTVTVTGGDNIAVNPCCCPTPCVEGGCCQGGGATPDVIIAGNGAHTENEVKVKNTKTSNIGQAGATTLSANITLKAKTGKNKAKHNTGPGSVNVTTGAGTTSSDVSVAGGTNSLP